MQQAALEIFMCPREAGKDSTVGEKGHNARKSSTKDHGTAFAAEGVHEWWWTERSARHTQVTNGVDTAYPCQCICLLIT